MIIAMQQWEKIIKICKFSQNGTMCKGKWKFLNSNYKKIVEYHKGTGNHI